MSGTTLGSPGGFRAAKPCSVGIAVTVVLGQRRLRYARPLRALAQRGREWVKGVPLWVKSLP